MINAAPSPEKAVVLCDCVFLKLKLWIHVMNVKLHRFPFCGITETIKVCNMPIIVLLLPQDFREKNTEHMRPEVVSLTRSSGRAFLHHLVASSPEALFRWGVLRATIRILTVFKNLGRQRAELSRSPQLLIKLHFQLHTAEKKLAVSLQDKLVKDYVGSICLTHISECLSPSISLIYFFSSILTDYGLVVLSQQLLPEKAPESPSKTWSSAAVLWTDFPGTFSTLYE